MLKYIISSFFLCSIFIGIAQNKSIDLQPKDTTTYNQPYGLRVGLDLSRIIQSSLKDNYKGLELVADYRLTNKLYIAAELGTEENTRQEDLYNFTSSGNYIKLGVDINNYENWYGMNNAIHMGGRIAHSRFNQTINNYQIFNSNRYWTPDDFTVGSTDAREISDLSATWLEFVFGIKTELFANIFLGGSVRLGYLVNNSINEKKDNFKNIWIPGFNKVTEGSKFGIGYNYSISYLIPLYKKVKKKKKIKEITTP